MSIRQILLLAFLAFSVVFATLMTSFAYVRSRDALSDEIRLNLETQAVTIAEQIQAMMFERIIDLQGWQELDVMQEVKVADVDKRLARFLKDIKRAYAGIYNEILCVADGRIVAASTASLIGQPTGSFPTWVSLDTVSGTVNLTRPDRNARHPELAVVGQLSDAYTDKSIGQIYALFNWREIERLLDDVTSESGRHAMLVDRELQPLAVSRSLRTPENLARIELPAALNAVSAHGVRRVAKEGAEFENMLVGFAKTTAYKSLPELGWSVLVLTPEAVAFAAVHELLLALVVLFIVSVFIAIVIAMRLSSNAARPIQELTHYSRAVGADIDTSQRNISGSREITELTTAFNRMVENLKKSRTRLIRANKLAAVGEMASKLAHEVRTPLGIIHSSAQILDRQEHLNQEGRELVQFMKAECDRINQLVTGLLESAKPRTLDLSTNDINKIVNQVIDAITPEMAEKQIEIEQLLTDTQTETLCDPGLIVQALRNLLLNAYYILPNQGKIRVSTRSLGGNIEVAVEDNGPGVAPEDRAAILESFVSNRDGGIGLGLPIVSEIVDLHHGSLVIDDSELGGARFCIRIPITSAEGAD